MNAIAFKFYAFLREQQFYRKLSDDSYCDAIRKGLPSKGNKHSVCEPISHKTDSCFILIILEFIKSRHNWERKRRRDPKRAETEPSIQMCDKRKQNMT